MVNYAYDALCTYFTRLCNTGYLKQNEVDKLLLLTAIQRFVDCDFRGNLDRDDYDKINRALYKLYGTSCLLPYPEYYNNRNKRIMYTCSISELANRVENLEKNGSNNPNNGNNDSDNTAVVARIAALEGEINQLKNKEIVIPINDREAEVDDIGIWNNK